MEQIIMSSTMIITIICGFIATKIPWFNNKLIPIQNLVIGITISIIYYISTGDFSHSVTAAGLLSTGVYSLTDNLTELFNQKKMKTEE